MHRSLDIRIRPRAGTKTSIITLLIILVLTSINHAIRRTLTLSNEDSVLQQHIHVPLLCQFSLLIISAIPLIC